VLKDREKGARRPTTAISEAQRRRRRCLRWVDETSGALDCKGEITSCQEQVHFKPRGSLRANQTTVLGPRRPTPTNRGDRAVDGFSDMKSPLVLRDVVALPTSRGSHCLFPFLSRQHLPQQLQVGHIAATEGSCWMRLHYCEDIELYKTSKGPRICRQVALSEQDLVIVIWKILLRRSCFNTWLSQLQRLTVRVVTVGLAQT
jgi:hypothetical protein